MLTTLHGEVRGQDGEAASDTVSFARGHFSLFTHTYTPLKYLIHPKDNAQGQSNSGA